MQRAAARTEFQHVAEHRDPPSLGTDLRLAEQCEGGGDGRRIGVVAVVDHQRLTAGKLDLDQHAAPGCRLEFGERQRRQRQIGADQLRRRQHGKRVVHQVPAGRADFVGELGAQDVGLHG